MAMSWANLIQLTESLQTKLSFDIQLQHVWYQTPTVCHSQCSPHPYTTPKTPLPNFTPLSHLPTLIHSPTPHPLAHSWRMSPHTQWTFSPILSPSLISQSPHSTSPNSPSLPLPRLFLISPSQIPGGRKRQLEGVVIETGTQGLFQFLSHCTGWA